MFGYSIPLLIGRLFGVPVFILGILFLRYYRQADDPKAALRRALRSPWVWFFFVLAVIAFVFEVIYVSNQPAAS